ncbi:hypothetical protein GAMM_200004 [Gammaproteobacteria bacterium]
MLNPMGSGGVVIDKYNELRKKSDVVNEEIVKKLKKQNADQESALSIYGAKLGDWDRMRSEVCRWGECANACEAVLGKLDQHDFSNLKRYSELGEDRKGQHYCLYDKEANIVVEPTYKQFLYRAILDNATGEYKEGFSGEHKKIIDGMQDVFIGTPGELKNVFNEKLVEIGKSSDDKNFLAENLNSTLGNYVFESYKTSLESKNKNTVLAQELKEKHEKAASVLDPKKQQNKEITNSNQVGEISTKVVKNDSQGQLQYQPNIVVTTKQNDIKNEVTAIKSLLEQDNVSEKDIRYMSFNQLKFKQAQHPVQNGQQVLQKLRNLHKELEMSHKHSNIVSSSDVVKKNQDSIEYPHHEKRHFNM